MNMLYRLKTAALVALLAVPSLVAGQQVAGGKINNPLKNNDLLSFVDTIIDGLLKLGAVVAVLAMIYAGFMFVTASGDEKKISTAKAILLYSVIGIIILLGARAIADLIINTIEGVDDATR